MDSYRSRVVDAELQQDLEVMGAMLIEGAKAVGKTQTASRFARTVYRLDVDTTAQDMLETDASLLFEATSPILFDEWQEQPLIWNAVRRAVDDRTEKGLYVLTGSATPRDTTRMHSGAGRIGRIIMRPMSLLESGHSTGEVSLTELLAGGTPRAATSNTSIREVFERIVIGGWPEPAAWEESQARRWLSSYLKNIADIDLPALGPRRNPGNISRLMAALGRAVGTPLKRSTLEIEVGGEGGPIASETLAHYLEALSRLMVIEPLPAWRPHMRSATQLRSSAVHYFVDPALGTAALGIGSSELLKDLRAAGLHFESLALRDLRVYGQALGARFSSWRDSKSGAEVDVIVELPDARWAAIEIKLGEGATDAAALSLRSFAAKVDAQRHGEPIALIVINAGRFSYRRPDGVVVVPITVLGP